MTLWNRPRKRPPWATKLWFWVTDDQYDRLLDSIDINNVRQVWGRWYVAQWWVRENLIENPAKWVLCKIFGHDFVYDQCAREDHRFCVFCSRPYVR